MYRNNTGFWIHYKAYNGSTNAVQLNDAANHTLKLFIDGVLSDPNNTPEDIAYGECRIFVDPAESNGAKVITVGGKSSTADVHIISATAITDLFKPGTAFTGVYGAWDTATNGPKTGDVANHIMAIAQDNTVSVVPALSLAEVDALTMPGIYTAAGTVAQATGRAVSILGKSNTVGVNVIPLELAPFDVDYPIVGNVQDSVTYAEGTLTGTLETTIKGPIKLIKLDNGIKVIKL